MTALKTSLEKNPFVQYIQAQVRGPRDRRNARNYFKNHDLFMQALNQKGYGTVDLHTQDGLNITIRQNLWDARIVREIFFDKPYMRHFQLDADPIIVDIGGYIGDFSLFAAKYLNARHVIVYEPTDENFKMLRQNIENNGYEDRITAVNKAVSASDEVILNVQVSEDQEIHASAYWYPEAEQRRLPSVTLPELFETHQLESVDLLKVDCEGGEYDIFPAVPDTLFKRIKNIVFEYHPIDGLDAKLGRVVDRLRAAGFLLRKNGYIISAYRA